MADHVECRNLSLSNVSERNLDIVIGDYSPCLQCATTPRMQKPERESDYPIWDPQQDSLPEL